MLGRGFSAPPQTQPPSALRASLGAFGPSVVHPSAPPLLILQFNHCLDIEKSWEVQECAVMLVLVV